MKNKYLEELLNNSNYIYYSHTRQNSDERELLSSHLELTYKYYLKMEKYKNLDEKVKNIIQKTFKTNEKITNKIYKMYVAAIYYHDIGKINPNFQKNKMQNDLHIELESNDSSHAVISARIYIDSFHKEIWEDKEFNDSEKGILFYIVYYFGHIISRHHTQLEGINELLDSIKEKNITQFALDRNGTYEKQLRNIKNIFIHKVNPDPLGMYILCKLLYSCIITADFYATYEYMTENEITIDISKDKNLFKNYEESDLIKNIEKYRRKQLDIQGIDKLRCDMFLEAQRNLLNNTNKNIYYIEAPTGSGKTNIAINIAKILYQKNENLKAINYIFPFNTIIEQTSETFENYFEKYKDYMVINSITSMVKDTNEDLDYEQAYIKNIFKQYPIILTSHVNLFSTLFGVGKEANYSLYHLIDSIVVLDEIQAYSNNIWREMIEMFSKYSNYLNIKFIIMSATLPRLDKLLNKPITSFEALVKDTKKYYQNDIFKNSVKIKYDLLDEKIDISRLIQEILKYPKKKVLIECIKKDTADKLYQKLKNIKNNVYELTSDDNKYTRDEIIKKIKQMDEIILVSTQTIEAGLDIDMDIGFKDISFLDSEEQFLGRINRNGEKSNCIAYFFNLDDAKDIYKNDNRLEYNLQKEEVRKWLENKEFKQFYEKLMSKIYEKTEEYTSKNINNFYEKCLLIDYKQIEKTMKLINGDTIQLFLNYKIIIDNTEICGEEIFQQYKEIYQDNNLGYAQKKIKLSLLFEKLNLFIYTIYKNNINIINGEKFGNMYYIYNGEDYMISGRFNREKYLINGDCFFL